MSGFWPARPVLITGMNGLVGSWLAGALVRQGAQVVGISRTAGRLHPELAPLRRQIAMAHGDVRDQAFIERVLAEYEIDTVFHLAGQSIIAAAQADPVPTLDINVRGTWAVLEACRRSPLVRQIVAASSDKAYGQHATLPYHEELPLQGRQPYEVSKASADLIARSYARMFGLPLAVTRCANLYGGGDFQWNRLIPGTIRAALHNQSPTIRTDGQFVRDYLYIEDGVAAYLALAEQLATTPALYGEAFNFAAETPLTVMDVVEHILKCADRRLAPVVQGHPSAEIRNQYLSSAKARAALGWEPQHGFAAGIEKTVAWYRRYLATEKTEQAVTAA